MSLWKDMAGADGVVAAPVAAGGGEPIGPASVHSSPAEHGSLQLHSSWSRQVLGLLRSVVLLASAMFLLAVIGISVVEGRPVRWEMLLPGLGLPLCALLMPLFQGDHATLSFDGQHVRRPGSLQTPLAIRIAELDLERSKQRTLLDRVIGRQRLVNKDGRGFEYFRLWYPPRERDAFLAACFVAAEASAERVASGPVPRRAI